MLIITMLVLGIIYVVIGVIMLVAPGILIKLDSFLNTRVFDGKLAFRHKIIVAAFLLLTGAVMILYFYRFSSFVF